MVQRKTTVAQQVFKELYPFPNPKGEDPRTWSQHVRENLVLEVRHEIFRFYGQERSFEVKLPGLDYTYQPHRRRLNRYPYHTQLFNAFDCLDLTNWEIYELCNWEGTLHQKDKFLKEHPDFGTVQDTTGADLPTWEEVQRNQTGLPDDPLHDGASEDEEGYAEYDQEGEVTDKDELEMDIDEHTRADELAVERQGTEIQIPPGDVYGYAPKDMPIP